MSALKLQVAWHIAMTGKQPPWDPSQRKKYLAEWKRQKRKIKAL